MCREMKTRARMPKTIVEHSRLVAEVAESVVGRDERVDVVAAERGRGIVTSVVQTGASAQSQVSKDDDWRHSGDWRETDLIISFCSSEVALPSPNSSRKEPRSQILTAPSSDPEASCGMFTQLVLLLFPHLKLRGDLPRKSA